MKKKTIILFSIFAFFALSCNQPTRAQAQTADNEIEVVCEKTEEIVCEIMKLYIKYTDMMKAGGDITNITECLILGTWEEIHGKYSWNKI